MGNGSSKLNMSHSFPSYFGTRNFYAAPFADYALITNAFILTAMALPVLHRSENTLAEKSVFFGFLRPVIYGFGLCYFAP